MSEENGLLSTGVPSLDRVLHGGFRWGMHIVLSGESGSGVKDFVRSTMRSMLAAAGESPPPGPRPSAVGYISATQSYEEIASGLLEQHPQAPVASIKFLDLSPVTFLGSTVPQSWVLGGDAKLEEIAAMGGSQLMPQLVVQFLDSLPARSAVFLDFLTELTGIGRMKWEDALTLLYGVRRLARNRQHIICTLSNQAALGPTWDEQLAHTADGLLYFAWENVSAYQRQRIMYIRSWPDLSFAPEDTSSSKFEISYSPQAGFDVSTVRQILGR